MPTVPVNYLAVLVAAVASMIIGSLWYGPLFGKPWMALMGMTPEKIAAAKGKSMAMNYGLMFVGSFVMSFVLAHSLFFVTSTYIHTTYLIVGMTVGFWSWLGFVAPVTLGSVLWENKSWNLWLLNNGYYIVTLVVMGVILALWK